MRIANTLALLSALTVVVTVSACSTHRARHDESYGVTTAEWDSGPLDQDYRRERAAMEARHQDEIAHSRADESADRREARQAAERQQLEDRYRRGKEQHMKRLPPPDHDNDRDQH
jgi:hypothetical protein